MAVLSLVLLAVYLLVCFGFRTFLQWRRTGDSGFRGIAGRPGTAEWWAGIVLAAAILATGLGPVTALAGLDPIATLDESAITVPATAVAILGMVATLLTQIAMGASWRVGVDPDETTDLVTTGPFAIVRNPIYTSFAVAGIGFAFMVPNLVALFGAILLLSALHLQVRVVEEPYLLRKHGRQFRDYAAATGRFLPGLGLIERRDPVAE